MRKIRFSSGFEQSLLSILDYIATDKLTASIKFRKELKNKISLLRDTPYLYKQSIYFEDEVYRDLIYQGYTVVYKITKDKIIILEIFKWIEH